MGSNGRFSLCFNWSGWSVWALWCLPLVLLMAGCQCGPCVAKTGHSAAPNTLTEAEQAAGWQLLFDGRSLEHWTGLGREGIPHEHWRVENGTLRKVASGKVPLAPDGQPLEGGDIMTRQRFYNFEFQFDWKVSPAGNSGVKYNVSEEMSTQHEPVHAALGFEYQILDDDRHPDGEDPTHRAGGLYDLIPPNDQKRLNPVGQWNHSRLVLVGSRGQHWLNGRKVVDYDLESDAFARWFAASKYAPVEEFTTRRHGHLVLQDHRDDVWFRNLKVRVWPDSATLPE